MTEAPSQPSFTEAEVAVAIALILAGQAPRQVAAAGGIGAAMATALLAFVPVSLPRPLRASVGAEAAALVLRERQGLTGGSGATSRAQRDNLVYRALYGINATRRIVRALASDAGRTLAEKLDAAVEAEEPYYAAHKEASERRLRGAALNDAAAELHGPILSWRHLGTSKTHRPEHERANGANFDIRNGAPRETGALPSQAMHCDCVPGRPIPGARMLR